MILTAKQEATLRFIAERIQETDKSPTVQEMMEHFDLAGEWAVTDRIRRLERKGMIVRKPKKGHRNIKLTIRAKTVLNLQM